MDDTAPRRSDAPGGLHHVAYAARDMEATHQFYGEVLGLKLSHTELTPYDQGWFRHAFYECGDGSCLAFFDLHGVGEPDPIRTAISTDLGLPMWVNHLALAVDAEQKATIVARAGNLGVEPLVELDHGWCVSTYFEDPNGILVELCLDNPGMPVDPAEAARLLRATPATA